MKYCKNCGKEIVNEAVICPHCGVPQEKIPEVVDSGSIGWGVLGFCLPLVGLILFLAWNGTKPKSAKKAGMGALIGFCLSVFSLLLI